LFGLQSVFGFILGSDNGEFMMFGLKLMLHIGTNESQLQTTCPSRWRT
jgi:hypothetical protein